ncbi:MAG: hypothetical protein IKE61_02005 [Coriobacteriales bacterium]|nr:hypothetical protein [Coriobacteriales bacterium]
MKQGIAIETSAAVFIYDRGENLVAATIVEADIQRDGISFVSHGFEKPARAKDMRDSLLAIKGADDVLGWLHSHSGRARCFVTPPCTIPAGALLRYLESIEKIYFKSNPDAPVFEIKPSSTRS